MEGNNLDSDLDLNYATKGKEKYNDTLKNTSIEVNLVTLTECNGNMKKLYQEYLQNNAIKQCTTFKDTSKGRTAEAALLQIPVSIAELAKELSKFMDATCNFLENIGVKFETTDKNIANAFKQ